MLRVFATTVTERRHVEVVKSVNTWHRPTCTRARSAQVVAGLAEPPRWQRWLSRVCVRCARLGPPDGRRGHIEADTEQIAVSRRVRFDRLLGPPLLDRIGHRIRDHEDLGRTLRFDVRRVVDAHHGVLNRRADAQHRTQLYQPCSEAADPCVR